MTSHIKSVDIKPNDIVRFEFGDYGNWVTARIDEVHFDDPRSNSYYPQKLIWHYLSDEEPSGTAALSQAGQQSAPGQAYRQFICYSNPNDIVEKLN